MLITCPVCGFENAAVDSYKLGSILACKCGELLQFTGTGVPPRVVTKEGSVFPDRLKPDGAG
jgi:hypothetical protein